MDLEKAYKIDLLQCVDFLSSFSVAAIEKLILDCHEVAVNQGDTVLTDGEMGETLYIVLQGELTVYKDDIEIAQRGPGDYFGEMALLVPGPRSATVKTTTDSLLLEIDKKQFRNHFGENSHALLAIMRTIADRSREDLKALSQGYQSLKKEKNRVRDARQVLNNTSKISDAKTDFITSMSQEVITHLNSILTLVHALEENTEGNLSAYQKDTIKQILNEGDELLQLVREAFEFASVEEDGPDNN